MINVKQQNSIDGFLYEAVTRALQSATAMIAEEEIKKATEKVEKRLRERVGSIATEVCTFAQYERLGTELIITVKFPQSNEH